MTIHQPPTTGAVFVSYNYFICVILAKTTFWLNRVKALFVHPFIFHNSYFLVSIPQICAFLQGLKNHRTFAPSKGQNK